MSIPKLILEFHTDQVSGLHFSNTQPNLLFSSSYDKFIIIWKINPDSFSGEKLRAIPLKSEISDFALYPDDSYILAGCFNNNVYIIKCDYVNQNFDTVAALMTHDNIVNSISLDPFIETNGRFASISDKGRLIIASFNKTNNIVNVIHNFDEFVNGKHKCVILQKKIDWSVDGRWLLSVDHHLIKKHNILHARLINMDSFPNTQALIGHDSPVLIARFSKCLYCDKNSDGNNEQFQLCATSDKNGNLIIWKVEKDTFSVLVEISSYSESNVTNMIWSNNGEFLITVNSTGSVCCIEFNEFNIKITNKIRYSDVPVSPIEMKKSKRKIVPTLIQPKPMVENSGTEVRDIQGEGNINYYQNNVPCLKCQKQLYQVIENQVTDAVVENIYTKDQGKLILSWENHPFDNCSVIKMKLSSDNGQKTKLLYANKLLNRMIKLFSSNNFYFAFYDTNFTLNVYSLLNTMLISKMYIEEISIMSTYLNYILVLTTQNKMIILDVLTQEKIMDEYLNLNSTPYNVFQTKIDEIYFVSLNQILIKADSFNPYKNTNNKMILYFDSRNKNLMMSSNSQLTQEEQKLISNLHREFSIYNRYFAERILFSEIKEINELELFKISANVDMLYDNLYKAKYFNNKDLYINNVKNLIGLVKDLNCAQFRFILDDFITLNQKVISLEEFHKLTGDTNVKKEDFSIFQTEKKTHTPEQPQPTHTNSTKKNEKLQIVNINHNEKDEVIMSEPKKEPTPLPLSVSVPEEPKIDNSKVEVLIGDNLPNVNNTNKEVNQDKDKDVEMQIELDVFGFGANSNDNSGNEKKKESNQSPNEMNINNMESEKPMNQNL